MIEVADVGVCARLAQVSASSAAMMMMMLLMMNSASVVISGRRLGRRRRLCCVRVGSVSPVGTIRVDYTIFDHGIIVSIATKLNTVVSCPARNNTDSLIICCRVRTASARYGIFSRPLALRRVGISRHRQ